jgi:hypothetical protein
MAPSTKLCDASRRTRWLVAHGRQHGIVVEQVHLDRPDARSD